MSFGTQESEPTAIVGRVSISTESWISDNLVVVTIVSVVLGALLLTILLATGPIGSDDVEYFRGAGEILRNFWAPETDTLVGRKLFLLLSGIPAAVGGKMVYGVIADIAYTTMLNIVVARFTYRQFGAVAALSATVVASLNGTVLLWAGTMTPDVVLSLWMFLSTIALYYALLPGSKDPMRLIILSGALAGVSYGVKEPGILLLPPATLCLCLCRAEANLSRRALWVGGYLVAFGCVFVADGLLQLALADDFLRQIHALQGMQPKPAVSPYEFIRLKYWDLAKMATSDRDTLLIPMLVSIVASISVLRARLPVAVFGTTSLFVAAYLLFGTTSLSALHPMPFEARYWVPVFPLAAVCLASVISRFRASGGAAQAAWLFFLTAFALVSITGAAGEAGNLGRARYFKNVANAIEFALALPGGPKVMVDASMLEVLCNFMAGADLARLELIPSRGDLPAGLYLVDPYQNSIVRLGQTPHFSEITKLPVILSVNRNPLIVARYFPDVKANEFEPDPAFTAILREKR